MDYCPNCQHPFDYDEITVQMYRVTCPECGQVSEVLIEEHYNGEDEWLSIYLSPVEKEN